MEIADDISTSRVLLMCNCLTDCSAFDIFWFQVPDMSDVEVAGKVLPCLWFKLCESGFIKQEIFIGCRAHAFPIVFFFGVCPNTVRQSTRKCQENILVLTGKCLARDNVIL